MAKSRLRPNKKSHSRKIKAPKWSKEKRTFMIIIGVIWSIIALLAIAAMIMRYYRLVTK